MTHVQAPIARLDERPRPLRLALLLGTAGLPVVATTALAPVAIRVGLPSVMPYPLWIFALYAATSWLAVALLVSLAGLPLLRAAGLRLRWSRERLVVACLSFAIGVGLYLAIEAVLPHFGLPAVGGMAFELRTGVSVAVVFVAIVITAPVCEEILFRVAWVGVLGAVIGVWRAAICSLIVFAAIHYPYFGTGGVVFIALWSLLPLALFVRYGDLTAPLLMHVLNNGFAYVVVPLFLA